jgi:hypothetical protein
MREYLNKVIFFTLFSLFILFLTNVNVFQNKVLAEIQANKPIQGELVIVPQKDSYHSNEDISFVFKTEEGDKAFESLVWKNYKGSPFPNQIGAKQTYKVGRHLVSVVVCLKGTTDCKTFTKTFKTINSAPEQPEIQMSPENNLKRNTLILFGHSFGVDVDGDPVSFQWKIDNGKWSTTPPTRTFTIGKHTIYLRAKDKTGKYSSVASKVFEVENSAPTKPLLVFNPKKSLYSTTKLHFKAASSDIDWDTFHFEWQVDNKSWSTKNPGGNFPEGEHVVKVRAIDKRGAISEYTSVRLLVGNTPPSAPTITINPEEKLTEQSHISFDVSGSVDLDNDPIVYEYKIDDGNWGTDKLDGSFKRGTHTFYARARDSKGTYSKAVRKSFKILNTAPSLPLLDYSPKTDLTNLTEIAFDGHGSVDLEGDKIRYEWKIDDGRWTTVKPDGVFPGGEHTVYVRVRDSYGDTSKVNQVQFDISTLAKTITPSILISPKDSIDSQTEVKFKVEPDNSDLSWEWSVDDGIWSPSKPTGIYARGKHNVAVRAKDRFGDYTKVVNKSFIVENSKPTKPNLTINPEGTVQPDTYVSFQAESTDLENDTLTYYWKIDNSDWSTISPDNIYTNEGTYTVSVRAKDSFGDYSDTTTKTFVVSKVYQDTTEQAGFESSDNPFSSFGSWVRNNLHASEGSYSMQSPHISDGEASSYTIQFDIPSGSKDGNITFDWLVKSELNNDYFDVYIDGNSVLHESGIGNWKTFSKWLPSGVHTVEFQYKKNGIGSQSEDSAYVDNIKLSYKK